jgi:hypothetical protein
VKNPRYDEDYAKFARTIRQTNSCIVRLYVIKANNLMPMDLNGFADPYLKVRESGLFLRANTMYII